MMDDDKKPKKPEDEELKEAEEELEKIIKDVEEQLGVDRSNFSHHDSRWNISFLTQHHSHAQHFWIFNMG